MGEYGEDKVRCECETFMLIKSLHDKGFSGGLWLLNNGQWYASAGKVTEIGDTPLNTMVKLYKKVISILEDRDGKTRRAGKGAEGED